MASRTHPPVDRLPPSDRDAEMACCGAIILTDGACVPECVSVLTEEHFYDLANRELYRVAVEQHEQHGRVDLITVSQALRDHGKHEAIGGNAYIARCCDACHSPANLPLWIDSLKSKWRARQAIAAATQAVSEIYDEPHQAQDSIAAADAKFVGLLASQGALSSAKSGEVTEGLIDELEKRNQNQGKKTGVVTGFLDLDEMTNGLQMGQQTVLGARPSVGKSALAGNVIEYACIRQGVPTLVVSLEMSQGQFMARMAGARSNVAADRIKKGTFTDADFIKLSAFFGALKRSPLFFIEAVVKRLTATQISAAIRLHAEQYGVKFVVIDYLQIVQPAKQRQKRTDEVAEISSTLRRAAVATNTAVLALAQLNRECERDNKPRMPRMSDLRECGQIEQDADCILLLHRDKEHPSETTLFVAKQRDGSTGLISLVWLPEFCRFENAAKVDQPSTP